MTARAHDAPPRVAIVDYGAGNLVSIGQALVRVGADVAIARGPGPLQDADAVVVPGVGAAAPAMAQLRRRGLVRPIRAWAASGRPFLGICLGLQLLFEASDEDGARTLGLFRGHTEVLHGAPSLPHIGWNQVRQVRPSRLFDGIADGSDFYFVHSYAGSPSADDREVVVGETTHGETFVSAVDRGAVRGVQFHPERSGDNGLRLLANFVAIVRQSRRLAA